MTELSAITDDRIREIAAAHGVVLCDVCNQPKMLHVSYNHKTGTCGVDFEGLMLNIRYPDRKQRDDAVERLNLYFADLMREDEAELQRGAAI